MQNYQPKSFDELVGQEAARRRLKTYVESSKKRDARLPHLLLVGPPGVGKSTLAKVLAAERGVNFVSAMAPVVKDVADIASQLKSEEKTVFFLDEVHALPSDIEEMLYTMMDFHQVYYKGDWKKLNDLTIVGATTKEGLLSKPFRSRFTVERLNFCSTEEMATMLQLYLKEIPFTEEALKEIAVRARGTPRVAKTLLDRVIDLMIAEDRKEINKELVDNTFTLLEIDRLGLAPMDRKILGVIADKFKGGPVGIGTLSATLFEEPGTLEGEYEPYLAEAGLIIKTSRGRILTDKAWQHLGREPSKPKDLDTLFEEPLINQRRHTNESYSTTNADNRTC